VLEQTVVFVVVSVAAKKPTAVPYSDPLRVDSEYRGYLSHGQQACLAQSIIP
jgi:hypothetical protein